MELPNRPAEDRFVPAGGFQRLSADLRADARNADVPTLIVHAFDARTRMLPFIMWDTQIVPAGIRAVSAALANAGFTRQRTVTQAWCPNVRPSQAKIDGALPELLLVSSMQIHSGSARGLIRDAYRMGEDRPLVLVGGPKAIYQPWDFFDAPDGAVADVVVTGEEYVTLELLKRLGESRRANEPLRRAFERARTKGWLDDIPGLVYDRAGADAGGRVLVDTGVQRLVRDFDELPSPVDGYRYLEAPHRDRRLRQRPLPLDQVRKHSWVASILTTRGCKFRCGYCPIPAYNQFTFRTKSPEGLVRDVSRLRREAGFRMFFGTDDNFFNNEETVVATFEALARADFEKDDIGKSIRFGTEATEFDVHKQRHHLPLCYRGGLRAIWFGLEDLTAQLVNKGQSVGKTTELFDELRRNRIVPMAMMMHYDGQPLKSPPGTMAGLLNQVRFLKKAGAGSVQVTVLSPASGTKDFDAVMRSGIVLTRLGDAPVEDVHWDGNHVISAGSGGKPWELQRNLLLGYATFYNPWNLAGSLFGKLRRDKRTKWSDVFLQIWGMWALAVTACRLVPWMWRLRHVAKGNYAATTDVPRSRWPILPPSEAPAYVRQTVGSEAEPARAKVVRQAALAKY